MKIQEIKGWVHKKRDFGGKIFFDVRVVDPEEFLGEVIQVVVDSSKVKDDVFKELKRIGQESFLHLAGVFKKNEKAPMGKEFYVSDVLTYSLAESPYPLGKKSHSPDFLQKFRHLVLRSPRYQKIMLIRSYLIKFLREWYEEDGWIEVQPPIIVATACEGGATLFKLDYFGKETYLSQSAQLYLEALVPSLGKVFSLSPSFRAEKSRTRRHLTEFWHFEAEAGNYNFDDILKVQEESVAYAIQKLLENKKMKRWLKEFRSNDEIKLLERINTPFPRITYNEAIEILNKKGCNLSFGDDFGVDEEKILSKQFDTPFFITLYPTKIKSFYVKSYNDVLCCSADMMTPEGYGEITTGGQREDDIETIIKRIKKEGFDPEEYSWYLDLRRYGSVPHSGFGLGIERLIMWVLKLDHVRNGVAFPRTARRKSFI